MNHQPLCRLLVMLRSEMLLLGGVLLKLCAALLILQALASIYSIMPDEKSRSLLAMASYPHTATTTASVNAAPRAKAVTRGAN